MFEAPEEQRRLTVVNVLVVLNLVVFALWRLPAVPIDLMAGNFLVSWPHLADGRAWVLLTSVFSHHLFFHLVVNLIVLLSFGPPLERLMGSGRFLAFYLVAGLVASLAHVLVSGFLIGRPEQAALGASGAIAGLLILFSFTFPRAKVLLFFVIPLPAIAAALGFIALDVWGLVAQIEGEGFPIGHGAHLGGALTGLIYFLIRGSRLRETRDAIGMEVG